MCDYDGVSIGGTTTVVTAYQLVGAGAESGLTIDETVYSNPPDTAFHWDSTAQQWVFNQGTGKTTNLNQANTIYVFTIYLNDGSAINFQYGLK